MNYFISDLHIGHQNILGYDDRPFNDVDEMEEVMILNWNAAVGIDDDVYILGDISWKNVTKTIEFLKQLNGNLHLIVGNHDSNFLKNVNFRNCFVEITNYKELRLDDGTFIVLSHYPIIFYNRVHQGAFHLYGHVHNTIQEEMLSSIKNSLSLVYGIDWKMYNCGCMKSYMKYTPRTLRGIIEGSTE